MSVAPEETPEDRPGPFPPHDDSAVRTPIDVPTRETASFLVSHLRDGADVLEIGSGRGHVAAVLSRRGHHVTAIDLDPDSVDHARALDNFSLKISHSRK